MADNSANPDIHYKVMFLQLCISSKLIVIFVHGVWMLLKTYYLCSATIKRDQGYHAR